MKDLRCLGDGEEGPGQIVAGKEAFLMLTGEAIPGMKCAGYRPFLKQQMWNRGSWCYWLSEDPVTRRSRTEANGRCCPGL